MRQCPAKLDVVGIPCAARQWRQRRGSDGDPEHADGKLHEAKRVAEPRYWTVQHSASRGIDDGRGEIRVDENIDLHGGGAYDCRTHELHDLTDSRVGETKHGPIPKTGAAQTGPLHGELEKAADEGAECHAFDGTETEKRSQCKTKEQSADDRTEIEKHRGDGRDGKVI